ncbi:MAG: hypothetical protein AAGM16_10420 [Pseudomonadota bacterium]
MNASSQAESPISPLGRLVAALRSRHWSTFLLELVLITLGILIALYIDARIQERQDRIMEREYLQVMSRDLAQISAQLGEYVDYEAQNTRSATAILKWLDDGTGIVDYDAMRGELWAIASRRTLRLVSGGYTDLLSTGNLQLIEDRELRNAILGFFAEASRVQGVIDKNNTKFVDELILPFLLESGVAWSARESGDTIEEMQEASEYLKEAFGSDLSALSNIRSAEPTDPDVRTAIQQLVLFRARVSTIGIVIAGDLKDQAEAIQKMIDEKLAARKARPF